MLSTAEIERIKRILADNPTKNAKRKLKNKLVEHEYASKLVPFQPLDHVRYFVNRKTNEKILNEIIEAAQRSEIILLDTEMVPVYRQPNQPGIIQLEIISPDRLPTVIIIEVNRLPPMDSHAFNQMKEIFRIVLDSKKILFTWGTIDELKPFIQFGLFELNQIYLPENENLQSFFQNYWQQHHEHTPTRDCLCEGCIGREPGQTWKLIDAVAYQLGEWLDKRATCSPFNCGLDPRLGNYSPKQLQYRRILTEYAANDVLSMEKLLIHMQERPPPLQQVLNNNCLTMNNGGPMSLKSGKNR